MDGLRRARAADGKTLLRNTPTIFNVGFDLFFNWDGSSEQLPVHDERVLRNPALMNMSWEELLPRLKADAAYSRDFAAAYGQGITRDSVLDAIASYECSLVTPNSRFDSFLRGNKGALTPAEQEGYVLFRSIGCTACHQGRNIGGNLLQKFGVFHDTSAERSASEPVDLGYFQVTKNPFDREAFRVPSLRNVAMTAPYFHDGRAPTLQVAVATMARVQLGRSVTPEQIALIVGFLRTLTGQYQGRYLDADPLPAATPP
jgi:cytochrome c peroxidase